MQGNITKMDDGLLDQKHRLFSELSSENPPRWWYILKQDQSLYFEIRKDNIIDIYYQGGRVAEIKSGRGKAIKVTCHPKYLGHGIDEYDNPSFYKKTKDGKVYPIYQDCSKQIENDIDLIKKNIEREYSKRAADDDISEKFIQGQLIIRNPEIHLDSEFAYRLFPSERKTIRMDMVSIENNKIVFYELKRITDSRLNSPNDHPEIIEQMEYYRKFIITNKEKLKSYYQSLIQIKAELGLNIPTFFNVDTLDVDVNPRLTVANTYKNDKMNSRQESRWENIKNVLKSIGIVPELLSKKTFM